MEPALRANEGILKARATGHRDPSLTTLPASRRQMRSKAMSAILHFVRGIHKLWFLDDGRATKIKNSILAHTSKAAASQRAFHRLTSDEQAAFYVFLFSC